MKKMGINESKDDAILPTPAHLSHIKIIKILLTY